MDNIKIKFSVKDKVKTLNGDSGYIHAIQIQDDGVIYEVWIGDKYQWFSDWQIESENGNNIGFNVEINKA